MFELKNLLFVGLYTALGAVSMSAQASEYLADRHGAKSMECVACHDTAKPAEGATVSTQKCTSCHGSLADISAQIQKRGNAQTPDPHVNHSLGLNCNECHRGHQPSVNVCQRCHVFEYKVP